MGKRFEITEFVLGIGTLGATKADVVKAVGEDAIAGLDIIEGRHYTTFAAKDVDGVKVIDNLVTALKKYNRVAPLGYQIVYSVSLAVPVEANTHEAELNGGVVRSSFTSCRGIPTTTRFDHETSKFVLTTPTFWIIEIELPVGGEEKFTVTKFGCKPNRENHGLLEWKPIRRSEEKGGGLVSFTYTGEEAADKVEKTTHVNRRFLDDKVEEVKAELPRDAWQNTLARHVMSQMGRTVAVADPDEVEAEESANV